MLKNKYRQWLKSGFFSVFDQIIFSLANFILNIYLARTLTIEVYGLFSIIYSIVYFLNGVQNSLFTEPMMIYGPSKFHKNELGYIYVLQKYILIFTVLASFFTLAFMNFFIEEFNLQYFLYFFMLIPVILYFWFWRFVFYMQKNIKTAFWGDVVYASLLILSLALVYILKNKVVFNLNLAIVIIIFSSLLAIIFYWKMFKGAILHYSDLKIQSMAILAQKTAVIKKHFHYGKWLLLSSIMFYIVNRLYTPLLGFKLGLEQAGIYRAIENLFFPVVRITTALNLVIVPILAGKQFSQKKLKHITGLIILAFALFTLFYSLFIFFYSDQLILFIYNKQEFTQYKYLVLMFGIIYTVNAVGHAIINYFKVSEKSNIIFITRAIGTAALIIPAYFFLKDLTLIKATYLYLIGTAASVLYLIYNIYFKKGENGKYRVTPSS